MTVTIAGFNSCHPPEFVYIFTFWNILCMLSIKERCLDVLGEWRHTMLPARHPTKRHQRRHKNAAQHTTAKNHLCESRKVGKVSLRLQISTVT
jgi:hypothetical protein